MFSPNHGGGRSSAAVATLVLLTIPFLVGCASPGQPQPPSLHLAKPAQRLTAERTGDQVMLAWNTPETTTDGERVKSPLTAVVCLENASGAAAGKKASKKTQKRAAVVADATGVAPRVTCDEIRQILVTAVGPDKVVVPLPAALASGSSTLIAFSIELENGRSASAGLSDPVFVAAGAAPPPMGALTVSSRRESALVTWPAEWSPASGSSTVELKRTLISTPAGPVEAKPAVTVQPKGSAPFAPRPSKTPVREVTLRPDDFAPRDPGGMFDSSVVDGDTYIYVAQRVLKLTLQGHTLEVRGEPSPAVTFTYRDTFPPSAPSGLVLVPGGGFGEAPSFDLAWDANLEPDLLGYNVYRRDGDGAFVKINAEPLTAPAFRDLQVEAGHQYTYRVTAVDQRHNESAPGAEVQETLRK
jgi:hypothetical protein